MGSLRCGGLLVVTLPHQSLSTHALLLSAYLFAICSTDLQDSFFWGGRVLKQKWEICLSPVWKWRCLEKWRFSFLRGDHKI